MSRAALAADPGQRYNDGMNILLYLAVGLAVGVLSGALGTGGGVILVPALMLLCHFDQTRAVGTTLGVMVPPVGLFAALKYYERGYLDLEAVLWIAAGFAAGAWVGAEVATAAWFPKTALRVAFGLLLVYVGARFVLAADRDAYRAYLAVAMVVLSWLGFLTLRALGRRHPVTPLADALQRHRDAQVPGEPDYYI